MKLNLPKTEVELFNKWQYSSQVSSAIAMRARALLSLNDGNSVTATARLIGLSRNKLHKWLSRYLSGDPKWYLDKSRKPIHSPHKINEETKREVISTANRLLISRVRPTVESVQSSRINVGKEYPSRNSICKILKEAKTSGLLREEVSNLKLTTGQNKNLLRIVKGQPVKSYIARRADMILSVNQGFSPSQVATKLRTDSRTVKKWIARFKDGGVDGLFNNKFERPRKDQDEHIRSRLFSLLHSPPNQHKINRTSWIIPDLKRCLEREGIYVSERVISRIIKLAGYRWRKARTLLTSPDPDYRQKLDKIKEILSNLKPTEYFFSVDEMGPFTVKKREGRKLVAPTENYYIEQCQRSKGRIIITAALELSTNQVTHFYSRRKNTTETIKLIQNILKQYRFAETLYFTWDAASWHDSIGLRHYVMRNNEMAESAIGGPKIKIVPLPKSAQFLNVIESVFSGLAKAVIHNSHYGSKNDAMKAIDLYFKERNKHFLLNPKRAGKKIWGKEIVPAKFSESNNCKGPAIR